MPLAQLAPHVDDLNAGHRLRGRGPIPSASPGGHPRRKKQRSDLAPQRLMASLQRGGGAAQYHRRAGQFPQLEGDVPGVVTGSGVVLFVGPLMLLVEHDEPQVRLRGEHCSAGANYHAVAALPHPVPLVEALASRQAAVDDGHTPGEPGREALDCLVGQRDLRDQHYGPLADLQAVAHGVQVDLSLPAARHTLQQEPPASTSGARRGPPDLRGRLFLSHGHRDRRGRGQVQPAERVTLHPDVVGLDYTLLHERLHSAGAVPPIGLA